MSVRNIFVNLASQVFGLLGLAKGGTNADLSATGGASQVLRQSSGGAAVTVSQLAASDLSNGVTGVGLVVLQGSPTINTPTLAVGGAGHILMTGSGGVTCDNSFALQWKDSGAVARSLFLLDGGNDFNLGQSAFGGNLRFFFGSTTKKFLWFAGDQTTQRMSLDDNGTLYVQPASGFSGIQVQPVVDFSKALNIINAAATTSVLAVDTVGGGNGVVCTAPVGGGFGLDVRNLAHMHSIWIINTVTRYKDVATAGAGIPAIYVATNLTAQSAAIAATNLIASTSFAGLYRIAWAAKITTAASVSSVLGGANGFQVVYTDNDDSVVVTPLAEPTASGTGNTTQTQLSGVVYVNAKAATALQFMFGYTSVNAAEMVYAIHVRVEYLG